MALRTFTGVSPGASSVLDRFILPASESILLKRARDAFFSSCADDSEGSNCDESFHNWAEIVKGGEKTNLALDTLHFLLAL
jgi:hypothetical protein